MDLTLNESEREVRSAARRLFAGVLGEEERAAIEDRQDEAVLRGVVAAVGRNGWLAPASPGSQLFERMPFFAEAGAALAPGLVSSAVAGGHALAAQGRDDLQADVERGELLLTVASDARRAGLASAREAPLALDGGAGGRLRGTLRLVEYGAVADVALVLVGEPGAQDVVVVDLRAAGVERIPRPTFGNDFRADLRLDVELGGSASSGQDGGTAAAVRAAQTAIRVVECGGAARAVAKRTVDYVNTRHQFGKPLSQFQAVKQHAADMLILSEGAFWLAVQALAAVDSEGPQAPALSWAACWVPRAFKEVTLWAHQLHGGMGYARESNLFRWSERAKLRQIDLESQLDRQAVLDALQAEAVSARAGAAVA